MQAIEYLKKPPYLAVSAFLAGFLISILGLIMHSFSPLEDTGVFVWGIFVSMILIYAIFNTIFLFLSEEVPQYTSHSIYSFLGLGVACVLTSWMFTGQSLYQVEGFRSVLSVLGIGYTIFLGIGFSIRRIVDVTTKRDSEKLKRDSDEIGHNLF